MGRFEDIIKKEEKKKQTEKKKKPPVKKKKETIKPKKQTVIPNHKALPPPKEKQEEETEQVIEDIPGSRKRQRTQKRTNSEPDYENLDELITESQKATLMKPILDNTLKERKIEQETIELKKRAGEVMETSFGEFLYYGYMEKVNLDLLRMMKRIEPMIENMVNDRNTKGIIKRIDSEITNILKGVQKQQDLDAKNWKKEL